MVRHAWALGLVGSLLVCAEIVRAAVPPPAPQPLPRSLETTSAGVATDPKRTRAAEPGRVVTSLPEGHDLTTGLATGDTSTGIRIPADAGFGRWQALRFPLADIDGANDVFRLLGPTFKRVAIQLGADDV